MTLLTDAPAPPAFRRFSSWWPKAAAIVAIALCAGMAASLLFVWPDEGTGAEPSAADIFFHNALLGAILVLGTPYLAWPAVVFNSFFLGFVLKASVSAHGWYETARLTAVHIPIEVGAWLVTVWCSVLLADLIRAAWSARERPSRRELVQFARAGAVALVLYLVAAGAEWFELWLVVQGGNLK